MAARPDAGAALKRRRAAQLAGEASDDESPAASRQGSTARLPAPPAPRAGAWVPPVRGTGRVARPDRNVAPRRDNASPGASPVYTPPPSPSPAPSAAASPGLAAHMDGLALEQGDCYASEDDGGDDDDDDDDDDDEAGDVGDEAADDLNAAVAAALGGGAPAARRPRSPDNEMFNEAELGRAGGEGGEPPAVPVARVEYVETRDEAHCRLEGYPPLEERLQKPCWLCLAGDIGLATSKNHYVRKLQRIIDRGYGYVSNWELAESVHDVYEKQIRPALNARGVVTIDLMPYKVKEHIELHSLNPRFVLGEAIRFTLETVTKLRQCAWERDNDTGQVTPALKNIKAHDDGVKRLQDLYKVDQSKLAFYVPPDKDT